MINDDKLIDAYKYVCKIDLQFFGDVFGMNEDSDLEFTSLNL